jgi:hypothetical protein
MISFRKAIASASLLSAGIAAAACSDDPPPVAKVFVTSTVLPGKDGAAVCQVQQASWVNVGNANASIEDGKDQNGARVNVTCKVVPAGDGFDVFATVSLAGVGSLTVSGKMTGAGPQKPVRATFQRGDVGGQFIQNDCTVTYDTGMGIAAGRVWGRLECDKIQDNSSSFGNPPQPRTCAGNGEFRFENCSQ